MLYSTSKIPSRIRPFLDRLDAELDVMFFRYHQDARLKGEWVPAWWYNEQQTKTYVTLAIGNLCNGAIIQEPSVARKRKEQTGRADYYCRFGTTGNFVEFKQQWVRAKKETDIHLSGLLSEHNKARKQISDIKIEEARSWGVKFGIAMTLGALYCVDQKERTWELENTQIQKATNCLKKNPAIGAVSFLATRANYQKRPIIWVNERFEDYPGVIIIWSIRKFRI